MAPEDKLTDQLPVAEIVTVATDRQGASHLELQVNIEGRLHRILLAQDDLHKCGFLGPAVAEELQKIANALVNLREPVGRLAANADTLAAAVGQQQSR